MSEGIDGIVYLLNQAGMALARANAENARLSRENVELRAQLKESAAMTEDLAKH